MKKALLLISLAILFFAQSSYANKKETMHYKGPSTGATWTHFLSYPNMKNCCVFVGSSINKGNILDTQLEAKYTWVHASSMPRKNKWVKTWGEECLVPSSKKYLNLDKCEKVTLQITSHIKKESENTNRVKKFVKKVAQDICEDPHIVYTTKIKRKTLLGGTGWTVVDIMCPKVLANKKVIENEEKRLAEEKRKEKEKEKEKERQKENIDNSQIVTASSGTGFFVSTNGHMVTNNHVIEGCDVVKAHYKGRELDADVLFTDRSNDLAIIKANIKPEKVFPVSNEDVSLLEDIIVAGYPLGKNISASIKTFKGSVTALAGFGDNYSNFQIDASLSSGNSGGPIINQKGNVVGVAVEKLVEVGVEGFNFGVKSSTLKTFASSNQIKFEPASTEELSNKELGQLITEATIYLECWMSVAKIKQIIQEGERQKAFFSEYK
jgi:S1-C subfamily serine protease